MGMFKTKKEINAIRVSANIVSEILKELSQNVKEGVTPIEINLLCNKLINNHNAIAACLGYYDFPASMCISVNEVAIHGIPNKVPFKNGDLVSLDLVVSKNGYLADSAITVGVGELSKNALQLKNVTEQSLLSAIHLITPGVSIKELTNKIKEVTNPFGYGIISEYCGHGIGSEMHEEPLFSHDPDYTIDFTLKTDMVICIEPMITEGTSRVKTLSDGWSVITADNSLSAHFEHTVLVTDNGYEILTL